ncbi:MAG TPA: cytochrome c peroxidase [Planctomycetota bacterium]|nr:cytochrome c peroxidase [Planctomycetota bacterium]
MSSTHLARVLVVSALSAALAQLAAAQTDSPMPGPTYPAENPPNPAQEMLGKLLFWEEQLSYANSMSCGTCHILEASGSDPRSFGTVNAGPDAQFGTDDDIHGSQGVVRMDHDGSFLGDTLYAHGFQVTARKAPPAINAFAYKESFWDGRAHAAYVSVDTGLVAEATAGALESQAAGPPVSDVEMTRVGHTWDDIEAKLAQVQPMALATDLPAPMQDFIDQYKDYPAMFAAAYGDPAITGDRIIFAIGNYERTLVSDQTPFDDYLKTGVIASDLQAGLTVFQNQGSCTACHTMPALTDDTFHNIGVRPDAEDVGRMAVTGDPLDMAKFKTPGLRNAALRLPLMHNGSKKTLAEVVDFYDIGGEFPGPNLDTAMLPLFLSAQDKADLIHFLDAGLTDARVAGNLPPFDRPTLRSEMTPLNTVYGTTGRSGDGSTPSLIAHLPANRGNPNWLLGLADSTPNSAAVFALASRQADGSPLPDKRFPIGMNVDVGTIFLTQILPTDGLGYATFKLAIPSSSALLGLHVYGQWFITDPAVTATTGVYGSRGVAVEIL